MSKTKIDELKQYRVILKDIEEAKLNITGKAWNSDGSLCIQFLAGNTQHPQLWTDYDNGQRAAKILEDIVSSHLVALYTDFVIYLKEEVARVGLEAKEEALEIIKQVDELESPNQKIPRLERIMKEK